jgi:cytochrome b561
MGVEVRRNMMTVEDPWNPYIEEQPQFKRSRTSYVVCAFLVVAVVAIVTSILDMRQPRRTIPVYFGFVA